MIVFIPAFILLGAAVTVIVLQFVPRGTGFAWFAAVLFSIAAWIVTILLRTRLPLVFTGQYWIPLGLENQIPAFQLDIISWPFGIIVSSLAAGILLVSSTRIGLDSNPAEWACILTIGALGYLGVISANILTVMLILACLDFVELIIQIVSTNARGNEKNDFKSILWRVSGLTVFLAAYGWQMALTGTADDWRSLQAGPVQMMLLGCAIRMQLVPIQSLIGYPKISKNGFHVVRNIIGMLLVSVIIIQLPFSPFLPVVKNILLIYLLITSLTSSIRIAGNKSTGDLLIDWQVAAGSLICAVFVMGFSSAGIALLITLSVLVSILGLSYQVNVLSKILGILAVVGISGLPLTPNVSGFLGFGLSNDFPGLLFIIPVVILQFSSIQIILKKLTLVNDNSEQWTKILSPIGLIFPIVSSWVIFLNNISSVNIFQVSIPAIITSFICVILLVNSKLKIIDFYEFYVKVKQKIPRRTLSNNLINEILRDIRKASFQSPLISITNILEGEGGVLWSILSLVLIITIIRTLGFTP